MALSRSLGNRQEMGRCILNWPKSSLASTTSTMKYRKSKKESQDYKGPLTLPQTQTPKNCQAWLERLWNLTPQTDSKKGANYTKSQKGMERKSVCNIQRWGWWLQHNCQHFQKVYSRNRKAQIYHSQLMIDYLYFPSTIDYSISLSNLLHNNKTNNDIDSWYLQLRQQNRRLRSIRLPRR